MSQTNLLTKANNLSFKTKAIALAVLLAVLPVLGTGAFAALISAQNLRAKETAQQQLSARSLSQNLTRFLDLRSVDIQNVAILSSASDPVLLAKTPITEQQRLLKALSDRYQFYDSIAIVDLNGKTLKEVDPEALQFDVSALKSGVYIVKVELKTGELVHQTFVKESN